MAIFYTDRERAALAWTEAVTLVTEGHVPDELYEHVRRQFSEKELVDLTLAVVAINGWNRLSISFRKVAGTYQPPAARPSKKKHRVSFGARKRMPRTGTSSTAIPRSSPRDPVS
jgi:Uncharacterized conserved protein